MTRPPLGLVATALVVTLAVTVAARWPRAAAAPAARDASAEASGSEIQLVVAGGPAAGRYDVTSEESLCTEGLLGARTWGVQYSRGWPDDGLAGLQLVVTDTAAQDAGPGAPPGRGRTTAAFRLDLAFGRLFEGVTHEVETRPGVRGARGRGIAVVRDSGAEGFFRVDARTDDDVAIAVTVHCRAMRRLPMLGPRLGY